MSNTKNIKVNAAGGIFIPITVVLIMLKLFGLINISWWAATVLIWGSIVFIFVCLILAFILGMVMAATEKKVK